MRNASDEMMSLISGNMFSNCEDQGIVNDRADAGDNFDALLMSKRCRGPSGGDIRMAMCGGQDKFDLF